MHPTTTSSTHLPWKKVFIGYMAFLLTVFVLAYLKMIPVKLQHFPYFDTAGHFILLGLASYLSHRALDRKMVKFGPLPLPLGPSLISLFIIIEECLQSLSPYRTTSWSDMFSNLSGIFLFYLVDQVIVWLKSREKHN